MEQEWEQALYEIDLDRQRQAEDIARRAELGMTTVTDAAWIRSEYGLDRKELT